ncbi:LysR family transcriptional regulator [Roseomonas eburnea]|uniref:LysR family transcriptional regulator n=1 Tax=Neoroseomonas eburnea TaxID=1346889 RepID=A0A9X9X713_9PROT|nr:LysR substrate-binding domain-containing protein [Neoroseomonas eburnea]MBR0679499.1 LysR family transcriptional regulator [Neoroseomonas eburnea]
MELRLLRAFATVAETLHFARAAERLGISPPSLTEQVQELERRLGARLFVRTKRSVALSDAGKLFLEELRPALEQLDRAERVARLAGRGARGIIEIGFAGSAALSGVLAQAIAAWRREHPEVELHLHEMESAPQIEALAEGRLDIGFVRAPVTTPPGIVTARLRREPVFIALPPDHALIAEPSVPAAALAGEAFIIPDQEAGMSFHHHTLAVAERGGFAPRLAHRGRDLIAVATLVALGLGVAVVPESLCQTLALPGVTYRPLRGAPILADIVAAFRRAETAPATRTLIRQIRGLAEAEG